MDCFQIFPDANPVRLFSPGYKKYNEIDKKRSNVANIRMLINFDNYEI